VSVRNYHFFFFLLIQSAGLPVDRGLSGSKNIKKKPRMQKKKKKTTTKKAVLAVATQLVDLEPVELDCDVVAKVGHRGLAAAADVPGRQDLNA
jgi:hypothetical protein